MDAPANPPKSNGPLSDLEFDWQSFDFEGIFRKSPPAEVPALADSRDKYKILLEISKALTANLVLDELLVEILDTVLQVTRMRKGLLMLRDEDGRFRVHVARNLERKSLNESDFEVSRSVIREVARTGRPIYIADIEKRLSAPVAGGDGAPRAIVSFPLKSPFARRGSSQQAVAASEDPDFPGPHSIGLIYVESPLAAAEFPVVDLELAEALAGQAAIAIENARFYERVNRDRLVLADENVDLRREVRKKYAFENIVGSSERMRAVYDLVARVSGASVNVLLRGESGTGKEVFAKTIHYNSDRVRKPFVSINCAALPETLLESELFGIEKGVATGVSKRIGKFEQAHEGSIFLDEIGDMSLPLQAKLLRALETREIERVGGKVPIAVNVRIIAATNRDLEVAIREGLFREDLYFRLNVVPIFLPPLRERRSDIVELIEHFISRHSGPAGKQIGGVTRAALEALTDFDWPGNVRELDNVLQRAILMCDSDRIDTRHLPEEVLAAARPGAVPRRAATEIPLERAVSERWTVDRLVREYAGRVLARNGGNLTRTARELGIDFKTLKKKIEEHGDGR